MPHPRRDVRDQLRRLTEGIFLPNRGQYAPETLYHGGAAGAEVWFAADRLRYHLVESMAIEMANGAEPVAPPDPQAEGQLRDHTVEVVFAGANPEVAVNALGEELPTDFNWLVGDINVTGVRASTGIVYDGLWQGVDMEVHGNKDPNGVLKSVFVVEPGADHSQIAMQYDGYSTLRISEKGELVIETPLGTIVDAPPVAFTEDGKWVNVAYRLDGRTVSFQVDSYDTNQALYIDPSLIFSRRFGSSLYEYTVNAMLECATSRYIGGLTYNSSGGTEWQNKPGGGVQPTHAGGSYDLYICKFNLANDVWEASRHRRQQHRLWCRDGLRRLGHPDRGHDVHQLGQHRQRRADHAGEHDLGHDAAGHGGAPEQHDQRPDGHAGVV